MIIILTGLARSGKSFSASYLKSRGFNSLVFSGILAKECEKKGLKPTKMNLSLVGDELRKKLGMGALGRLILKKIKSDKEDYILDGSRSVEEIEEIKKRYPNAKLVFIDALPDIRFSRRNEKDPKDKKTFFSRDEIDIKNKGLGKVINMADIRVENNGSAEELKKKLNELVKNLRDEEKYSSLGVKIGIEIHQRLNTHKLFCECDSEQKVKLPSMIVKRKLSSSVGEMGEFDKAVLFEVKKRKEFLYKVYDGESCLVELDEEPPHEMNREALSMGIQMCKLLNCKIPDEVHVMRKIVVDGSNTSGFQRTSLIGFNGYVESSIGNVGISSVCVEEEAARIDERKENEVVYKLNGLGIPLLEIATEPDIKTPRHTREVAEKIGKLLRSLNVQRGLGSIRQDINISVKGGARVEIKGFQNLEYMTSVIENEIKRQTSLIKIEEELKNNNFKKFGEQDVKDVTDIFSKCKTKFLQNIIKSGGHVFCSKLPGLKNYLKKSLGAHTLGKELAYYATIYGPKGIIHNDEDLKKYELENEFSKLKKILNARDNDIIFIVAGRNAKEAAKSVIKRASILPVKIPEETRAVVNEKDTKYMRPLPGTHRMYPETDIPPIILSKALINIEVPKTLDEYEHELVPKLGKELAHLIVKSKDFKRFLKISHKVKDVKVLSVIFTNIFKELSRDGFDISKITDDDIISVVRLVEKEKIPKSSIKDVLIEIISGNNDIDKFKIIDNDELVKIIKKEIEINKGKDSRALMKIIMSKYGKKVNGKKVFDLLNKFMR